VLVAVGVAADAGPGDQRVGVPHRTGAYAAAS
jgi:hypothetical protein